MVIKVIKLIKAIKSIKAIKATKVVNVIKAIKVKVINKAIRVMLKSEISWPRSLRSWGTRKGAGPWPRPSRLSRP